MTTPIRPRRMCPHVGEFVFALGLALLANLALSPAHAQPKEAGDLWEMTHEMSMPGLPAGMTMPQQPPQRVCRARNADKPPVADNDRCEMTDVKRSANAFSWKMACKGNPPSTGSGEIVYQGRDSYTGTMQMTVGDKAMTMKLTGKRVGDCDAGESRRQQQAQVAAIQQQVNDANALQCKSAVEMMMPASLRPEFNCGAAYKTELCNKAQSNEGFKAIAPRQPSQVAGIPSGDLNEVGAFCGFAPADLRIKLCKRAEEQETLDFLGSSCLGYSRRSGAALAPGAAGAGAGDSFGSTIVARECAGRSFSSPPAKKYVEFCSAAARQRLMQTAEDNSAAQAGQNTAPPKDDAASRGKKLLKDIFNR